MFKEDIRQIKHKLEVIDQDRYRGALVRAIAEHWAAGEMPTKRALGIEKTQTRRNQINEIKRNGQVTSEKNEVEGAFFEYYQALFAFREVDVEKFKRDFIDVLPRLEDDEKNSRAFPRGEHE